MRSARSMKPPTIAMIAAVIAADGAERNCSASSTQLLHILVFLPEENAILGMIRAMQHEVTRPQAWIETLEYHEAPPTHEQSVGIRPRVLVRRLRAVGRCGGEVGSAMEF